MLDKGTPLQEAPWTPEQVANLNKYQVGPLHPFTCGNCEHHTVLLATETGWVCPNNCGWEQTWAHDFMLEWNDAKEEHLRNLGYRF